MAKRIVSVILILSLLLAGVCAAAGSGFAAGDYDGDFDFGGVTVVRKNRDGACLRCGGKLPEGGAVCPYCGSATENSAFDWKVKRANKVK